MKPDRWHRIEELFLAARELDDDDRAALFDRECADDAQLRREVETMLAAAAADPDFLETPPSAHPLEP